jgi:(2R)-ethylmalonyl-CoA mutase
MRTYSGHSSAAASNALYRANLAKGQTGLSIAFDLPTQTGYDPDARQAAGEVGKVGVPVAHLGHMRQLFTSLPVAEMNTSMTINATAAWLLGNYIALADEQNAPLGTLSGTTQNDIMKEYLSRGTFIFPPDPSLRLIVDTISFSVLNMPKWNPINICSYHLQEAGATPVQEVAYALANAIAVIDAVAQSGQIPKTTLASVVGRISFFVNAGVRFIEETAKMRAFTKLWDEICATRYGVSDPSLRRFRYGVQVNSLGLTEQQPENNITRIVLEALGVTLSKDARARALQLPAWNEALGLPRPFDQQWSLRIQQVLAYESDLLEYDDIFAGSHVIEKKTDEIAEAARVEMNEILEMGGAFSAIEELKSRLVTSQTERVRRIESGEQKVVGVNCFSESEPSPLLDGQSDSVLRVNPAIEREMVNEIVRWRGERDAHAHALARKELESAARSSTNIMAATITFAKAGGTTGEWADTLREVFGEYRAPTGVRSAAMPRSSLANAAQKVDALVQKGGRPRLLVAKPGLDGHSNGAEQIAVAARDAGFEVIYQGIRLTPDAIAAAARDEDVDIVGLSILSGSHLSLVPEVLDCLNADGLDVPVVVGGIIPNDDAATLMSKGVAAVYTPKDFRLDEIVADLANLIAQRRGV